MDTEKRPKQAQDQSGRKHRKFCKQDTGFQAGEVGEAAEHREVADVDRRGDQPSLVEPHENLPCGPFRRDRRLQSGHLVDATQTLISRPSILAAQATSRCPRRGPKRCRRYENRPRNKQRTSECPFVVNSAVIREYPYFHPAS